jgi:hypothetical protein
MSAAQNRHTMKILMKSRREHEDQLLRQERDLKKSLHLLELREAKVMSRLNIMSFQETTSRLREIQNIKVQKKMEYCKRKYYVLRQQFKKSDLRQIDPLLNAYHEFKNLEEEL